MSNTVGFGGERFFLSNFSPTVLVVLHKASGVWHSVPTVEHAYQALKCVKQEDFLKICWAQTPGIAKRLGRLYQIRPDWDEVKVPTMKDLLLTKFGLTNMLSMDALARAQMLVRTGDEPLIESNYWHDNFWGSCFCGNCRNRGENVLGTLLMQIRAELKGLGVK